MKLFIDECLSNELVQKAIARGYPDTSSVVYRGLAGTKDWSLVPILVAEDLTLVTMHRARRDCTKTSNCTPV